MLERSEGQAATWLFMVPSSNWSRTPPFQGGNPGSSPGGITKERPANAGNALRWQLYEYRPEVRKCSFVKMGFAITICNCMASSSNRFRRSASQADNVGSNPAGVTISPEQSKNVLGSLGRQGNAQGSNP